jgi:hypothetical protein
MTSNGFVLGGGGGVEGLNPIDRQSGWGWHGPPRLFPPPKKLRLTDDQVEASVSASVSVRTGKLVLVFV